MIWTKGFLPTCQYLLVRLLCLFQLFLIEVEKAKAVDSIQS